MGWGQKHEKEGTGEDYRIEKKVKYTLKDYYIYVLITIVTYHRMEN